MESKEKSLGTRSIIAGTLVVLLALGALIIVARVPLARAQASPAPVMGQTGCTFGPLGTNCGASPCSVGATTVQCTTVVRSDAVTPTPPAPPPTPTHTATATATATAIATATPPSGPDCDNDGDPSDTDDPSECGTSTGASSGTANVSGGSSASVVSTPLPQTIGGQLYPGTFVCNSQVFALPGVPVPCQALPAPGGDQVCNNGQGPTIPLGLSCPAPTPTATPIATPVTEPNTVTVTSGDDIPRIPGRENQPPIGIVITRIGNQATIGVTNNTINALDLTHTVVIQTAPGVVATGATATAGSTAVSGSQVVWSNLSLDTGQQATITLNLAATGGGPLAAGGGPVIQSVTTTGSDVASGEAVAENSAAGASASIAASGSYSCSGNTSGSNCQSHVPGEDIAELPDWVHKAGAFIAHAASGLRALAVP